MTGWAWSAGSLPGAEPLRRAGFFQCLEKGVALFSKHWKKLAAAWILLRAVLAPTQAADPLLGTNEAACLQEALQYLNMTVRDLRFAKDHGKPDPVLSGVRRLLNEPLDLSVLADRCFQVAGERSLAVWALAGELLETTPPEVGEADLSGKEEGPWSVGLDPVLEQALRAFLDAARPADQLVQRTLRDLEPGDADELLAAFLAGLLNAEDHAEARLAMEAIGLSSALVSRVIEEADALDPGPAATRFLMRLRRVHLAALLAGGERFQQAVALLADAAAGVRAWPDVPWQMQTDLGLLRVGTLSDDAHDTSALLILDPGGDDRYTGAAGVADGRTGLRLAAIVDLSGNDRYAGEGLAGPGTALFGVSVLFDLAGDEEYRSAYAGQSAAFCGAAWLEDGAGDDAYRAGVFAQAAAFYGAAVLREMSGNDVYDLGLCGQGYAGVHGWALLADRVGHDRYFAGGRESDHERNDDRFLSFAQGFSLGMRPYAGGGIAVLADLEGNDTYLADVFGQGAGYWYGIGLLLDAAGHDSYQLHQYGQGAGIHLSLGVLADRSGDDGYYGYILAQGAAHDYGVGFLFDRAGDDTYTADHHAQGRALNNALAVLLDSNGNDAYFGRQPGQCQGIGNDGGHREYGSLAMLVDLAGRDRYTCGVQDGERWRRPDFGIVYDSHRE